MPSARPPSVPASSRRPGDLGQGLVAAGGQFADLLLGRLLDLLDAGGQVGQLQDGGSHHPVRGPAGLRLGHDPASSSAWCA